MPCPDHDQDSESRGEKNPGSRETIASKPEGMKNQAGR